VTRLEPLDNPAMRAFIRHPSDIPMQLQPDYQDRKLGVLHNASLGGLACFSHYALPVGTKVRIRLYLTLPVFEAEGRVVWCESTLSGYDVGVAFDDADEAFRVRMIEQLCHIEEYKRRIREREGRLLNGEEAAMEWISRYAADFPILS
jgi:hypothetical protein